MKIIVVGNGLAAYTFASSILKELHDVELEVFSDEAFSPYYRTRVLTLLKEGSSAESLAMKPEIKSAQYRVLTTAVKTLDCENKLVYTADAQAHEYDILVLANGASASRLPLPGGQSDGIFTIRDCYDAEGLGKWLAKHSGPAIVIGGGLLGLEAAAEIASLGKCSVTVLETLPYLLARQMDQASSLYVQERLKSLGVNVLCGVKVSNFIQDGGRVKGVKCDDGFFIDAETVVEAVGIRPNTFIAIDAGLKVAKGVIVDEYLRTSVEDVYAIGDVAEFEGSVAGTASTAMEMGKCLALNLTGKDCPFRYSEASSTLKIADLDVISQGNVFDKTAECIIKEDEGRREAFFVKDGLLIGGTLIGSRANFMALKNGIGKAYNKESFK